MILTVSRSGMGSAGMPGGYRLLPVLTGFFVAVLLISNVASSKLVRLGLFTFDGGTLLFPLSYIFSDLLTEVYGFRVARRTIWIGFAAQLAAMSLFALVGALPAPAGWEGSAAYNRILVAAVRIVAASSAAYFIGSWSNDVLMSLMKRWTAGRLLWTRTIGSTLVGEGVDTALFCVIAFAGTIPGGLLATIILSNYIFKCGVEIVATPLTYLACNRVKRVEGVNVIDYHKDYSPLSWRLTSD